MIRLVIILLLTSQAKFRYKSFNTLNSRKMGQNEETKIVDEENQLVDLHREKHRFTSIWKESLIYVIAITSISSLVIIILHLKKDVNLQWNKNTPQQPLGPVIVKRDEYHQLGLRHNHPEEQWLYPTLSRPSKETVYNFTEIYPKDYYQFEKRMDSLVRPYNDTDCHYARYGHQNGDGGYLVCQNLIHRSQALINVGIQAFDEFGCEFTTKYEVPNYQYDCTDERGYLCQTNNGRNIKSLSCLGDKTQWTPTYSFLSLKDMIDRNDLKGKKITLKLDGEGSEWDGLRTLPLSYLDDIDQILIQIHLYPLGTTHKNCWGDLDLLSRLEERFVSVNFNENNAVCFSHRGLQKNHYFTSPGIEVTLVNKKLIRILKPTRSYKSHPLNRVSFQNIPQRCPMND